MFWPGMNNDIENIVRTCNICQQYHKRQRRETFIPHEIPDIPWTRVDTDLFEIYSKRYLIVVDYISNFFYISETPDKCLSTVVLTRNEYFPDMVFPKKLYQTTVQNS